MIIRYKEYIKENNFEDGITTEEKELLKKYNIRNYKFNPNTKSIDIYNYLSLNSKNLRFLPEIRFGIVYDNFDCSANELITLKNCPKEITKSFSCSNNKITSLEFGPTIVGKNYSCYNNKLTSLKGCPEKIIGDFSCSLNNLKSLEYCPKFVEGDFICRPNNYIFDIEDYPLSIIKGNIDNDILYFNELLDIVKENEEIFINLLDDKIKFHQMIMRIRPDLITYYKNIPQPSKKSTLLI